LIGVGEDVVRAAFGLLSCLLGIRWVSEGLLVEEAELNVEAVSIIILLFELLLIVSVAEHHRPFCSRVGEKLDGKHNQKEEER
jgi:hypothetical protein